MGAMVYVRRRKEGNEMTRPLLWGIHILSGVYLMLLPWFLGVSMALGWVIATMCLGGFLFCLGTLELITATLFGFFKE